MIVHLAQKHQQDSKREAENLTLTKDEISVSLKFYTGKQGNHIVSIIPSLNVTGYGYSEQEAYGSLIENLETLLEDLFGVSEPEREQELIKLGWVANNSYPRQMSSSFIDEREILEQFDNPEQVVMAMLQAA